MLTNKSRPSIGPCFISVQETHFTSQGVPEVPDSGPFALLHK